MILYIRKKMFRLVNKEGVIGCPINLCVLETYLERFLVLFWCCSFLLPNKNIHLVLFYNISGLLCLEMPAPSGSPALLINFIFTKAVYLKLCALAVESKDFPDPSGLFTLFKVNCCGVHDVLSVLPFSSLHYFILLSLCCGIPASTVCWSPRGNCKWKHLVLLRTPNFFYWLQNKCCLNK